MDHYVYIRSDDSDEYFKDNEPFKFKIHLKYPIVLKGTWKVGLTAFYTSVNSKVKANDSFLYLYCSFCKENVVRGQLQKLLRCLSMTKQNKWEHAFQNVYYVPVSVDEIFEMEFHIGDRDGNLASFLHKPVTIELHFKPYPFLFWRRETWILQSYTFRMLRVGSIFSSQKSEKRLISLVVDQR